jgi:TatD DNase family protein
VITDTHSHLHWPELRADLDGVLARARAAGVERMVVVGTDVASSTEVFELCAGRPGLFPTAGVHPHDAQGFDADARTRIAALCARPECVAVGETGLDFFKDRSPRADQLEAFRWHAELAARLGKPLVVHCRDAHPETLALLRAVPGVRGVMHCYTLGAEELPGYLELGFHISFSGVVTYPRNAGIRAAARAVPGERILFETDCPFLPPQGRRGTWPSEPAFVRETLEFVAALRGEPADLLARASSANAARLFGLPG